MEMFTTKQGMNKCAIIVVEKEINYEIEMLLHNKIENIIRPKKQTLNGATRLIFETNGMVELRTRYSLFRPGMRHIINMITALKNTILECEKHMLSPDRIVMNPDFVFTNNDDEIFYLYAVGETEDFISAIKSLIEYYMKIANYEDEEGIKLIYDLYAVIMAEGFGAYSLVEYANNKLNFSTVYNTNNGESYNINCSVNCNTGNVVTNRAENKATFNIVNKEDNKKIDNNIANSADYNSSYDLFFNDTYPDIYRDDKDDLEEKQLALSKKEYSYSIAIMVIILVATIIWIVKILFLGITANGIKILIVFLAFLVISVVAFINRYQNKKALRENPSMYKRVTNNEKSKFTLISLSDYEKSYIIAKEKIIIGREGQEVDIPIKSKDVSRKHAVIYYTGTVMAIEDLGSTNGTYVNGTRINKGEKVLLASGDKIDFAEEKFQIRE